jgi:phage shock protein PspC (stress-responsive transcriptional regulator)
VKEVGGVRKRLFRDIDNKIIGGVSAGLAKYFGIQVRIIRILFLIPFIRFVANFRNIHLFQFWEFPDFPNFLDITFSPGAVFIYIILWLVLPEAKSSADKLEMVGEKVDLNSIKNIIQNDMESFSKRAQSWGSEFYKTKKEQTAATTSDNNDAAENPKTDHQQNINAPAQKTGFLHFIGKLVTIIIKVFVFFVLGVVGISILAALFGIGVAGTSLLPLKGFLIEDGIQSVAAIGTILFFIWVPVIGIVTAVIRRFAGFKKTNKWVRASFIALWVLGWISIFYFFSSLGNSFSKHNQPVEENVQLTNPKVDFLRVTATPKMIYYEDKWFQITPFGNYGDEDTVFVRNLRVRIVQSKSDSFEIKVVKLSNGKTVKEANTLATNINFNLTQADSVLYLDRGIGISTKNKFRNQHIIMTIGVPVGKRILITSIGWFKTNVHINGRRMRTETIDRITDDNDWYDEWNEPWDNESLPYDQGVEYKMTATGLQILKPAEKVVDDNEPATPIEIESKLEKLKEERLQMEKDKNKGSAKIGVNTGAAKNLLVRKTSELLDFHWVLDRFSY